jgi:hypothetical protein
MLASERLRKLLAEPFAFHWLGAVDKTLEDLPGLNPEQRVAIFVARRVCGELARFLESIEPIESDRHDRIAAAVQPVLAEVISLLAAFQPVSWATLADLIAASRKVRRHG